MTKAMRRVPNPLPLSAAGMLAALGAQAVAFGLSIGGGEAYLLPNLSARGALHMHWLMAVSTLLETALVYECCKHSICTGRSFFAATADLAPRNVWPWFWAAAAVLTWAWPAWLGGATVAAERLTGVSTPKALEAWGLPSSYAWSAVALLAVLLLVHRGDRAHALLAKLFTVIMFANVFLVLLVTLAAAQPHHYGQVLMGYLGVTFLREGYPAERLDGTLTLALFSQPGGPLMWTAFWVVQAGFGMGRYAAPAGPGLRPPERIVTEAIPWDASDPQERRKMHQWVRLCGYSLILGGAVLGVVVTYLYSVASLAALRDESARTGRAPDGALVPIQMATVAHGVLGPMAGWLMLLFLAVMLYQAQVALYDTFVGRTTCEAIAVTTRAEGRRPYRFHYSIAVTAAVLAGLYLITIAQPFNLWIGVAISALVCRSIGAWQIWLINRRLPEGFRVSRLGTGLLWLTVATGLGGVLYWAVAVLPAAACGRGAPFCP